MDIKLLNKAATHVRDVITQKRNTIYEATHTQMLENNEEILNFIMKPDERLSEYLRKRNRLIVRLDGFFREFIIEDNVQDQYQTEVYCTGSHSELGVKKPLSPAEYEGQTVNTITDTILSNTGWKRGKTEGTNVRKISWDDYISPLRGLQIIANEFELELRFRVEFEKDKISGRYVDLVKKKATDKSHQVVSSKNLIAFKRTETTKDLRTGLIGLGPEDQEGNRIVVEVEDKDAVKAFGEELWDVHEIQSDNQEMTEDEVRQYTTTQLNKQLASAIQYECDAADLRGDMRLGDGLIIHAIEFKPTLYLDARVIGVERSLLQETQKKLILGDYIEYSEEEVAAIRKEILDKLRNKANRIILDENGQVIGEVSEDFNMSDGKFGNIDSPSVPKQSQNDLGFWISDRVIGSGDAPSDDALGDSWDHPIETSEEALRRTPKQLDHVATSLFAYGGDFWDYTKIDGFSGSGTIVFDGQGKTVTKLHKGMRATGSFVNIVIKNMTIIADSTYEIFSANAGNVRIENCILKGKPGDETLHGIVALQSARITVINSEIYGVKNGCYAQPGSNIHVVDVTGDASRYGLYARGGDITGRGTAPNGDVADAFDDEGGTISPNFTFPVVSDPTPTTGTAITKKYSAIDSGSYTHEYNTWDSVVGVGVVQGQDYGAGPYEGCWFFGSAIDEIQGKNIKQIRIYCQRNPRSGSGGEVTVEFHAHTHKTKPSGDPVLSSGYSHRSKFARSVQKWVTLPKSFYPEFQSGYRKGIGIYNGSGAYARMYSAATLEITYEE